MAEHKEYCQHHLLLILPFQQLKASLHLIDYQASVGIVGEILIKFHPDANNKAVEVIEREGGEAVVPDFMDFVLYSAYDDIYRSKLTPVIVINISCTNICPFVIYCFSFTFYFFIRTAPDAIQKELQCLFHKQQVAAVLQII